MKDRWLEEINSEKYLTVPNGKYEVSRGIERSELRRAGLIEQMGVAA